MCVNQSTKIFYGQIEPIHAHVGYPHDRENAAINIHMEGASSIGLGYVRPADTEAVSV